MLCSKTVEHRMLKNCRTSHYRSKQLPIHWHRSWMSAESSNESNN